MRTKRKPRSKFKPRRRRQRIPNDAELPLIDLKSVEAPQPPPDSLFMEKPEVLALVRRTFPCLWKMMREGKFPAARQLGSRPVWLRSEVEAWITSLPVRKYKPLEVGDAA